MSEFERIASVVSKTAGGGTPDRANPQFWNGGIPWASVKDFKDGSFKLSNIKEQISEKGLKLSSSNLIEAGTPIICTRMAVGRVARSAVPVAINQDLRALFLNKEITPDFFIYAVDFIRPRIDNIAIGSTVKGIRLEQLLDFEIFKPPLPEQAKIAEILSTVDRAIEQTEALIAKQQRIKTGLMADLLTRGIDADGNLRSEETHAFKDSPLGRIPVEWEVKELGGILSQYGGQLQTGPFGSQLHAHEYQNEGVPVVMPQDINNGRIDVTEIARIHERRADQLRRHRIRVGDIVIARRGDLSRAAAVFKHEAGWLCGTGCFLLRLSGSGLNFEFASLVYRQAFVQRQVDARAVGATMPSLNNEVMRSLLYPFCSPVEQEAIVERIGVVNHQLQLNEACRDKLKKQKQGLMQDLLTGKVRVTPLLEKEVPA